MNSIIFILGIIETLICIVCFFFKKQEHIILCLLVYNVILLVQYLIQGYYLEMAIVVISIIKSLIFYIYSKKNIRPNLVVLIAIEDVLLMSGIALWENWFSIFMLFSTMLTTYATWQQNVFVSRLGLVIGSALCIVNYLFTGLYTTIIGEAISVVSGIISIIIYDVLPKKKKHIDNKT